MSLKTLKYFRWGKSVRTAALHRPPCSDAQVFKNCGRNLWRISGFTKLEETLESWAQIRNRPSLHPFLISVHRFHSKSFKKAMVLLSSFAHLVCQAVAPPPTVIALVKRRVGRFKLLHSIKYPFKKRFAISSLQRFTKMSVNRTRCSPYLEKAMAW